MKLQSMSEVANKSDTEAHNAPTMSGEVALFDARQLAVVAHTPGAPYSQNK